MRDLVERVVEASGMELVDLSLRGSRGSRLLRVDIDRSGTAGVTIDDCQKISRTLGPALDEADLIGSRYVLEVSSPGADRPIRTADDVRRNTGRRVVVVARDAEGRQSTYRGPLVSGGTVSIRVVDDERGEVEIEMQRVIKAHQELTA